MVSEQKTLINLSGRQIIVWLVLIVGLIASTVLATAHYVFTANTLSVVALWAVRVVVLASFWLLPSKRDTKIFGIGLIALSLILDVLLKLPVLGSVEYADWFLVAGLDISGQYGAYFTVWGLLLPLLSLTGWFILVRRSWPGWVTGLTLGLGMGFVLHAVISSVSATFTTVVLVSVARFVIPALCAAIVDFFVRRRVTK